MESNLDKWLTRVRELANELPDDVIGIPIQMHLSNHLGSNTLSLRTGEITQDLVTRLWVAAQKDTIWIFNPYATASDPAPYGATVQYNTDYQST